MIHRVSVNSRAGDIDSRVDHISTLGIDAARVKCKYVTRNMGKGRKNKENADSYEGLWRNIYDSVTPSAMHFKFWPSGLDSVSPVIRLPIERGINNGTRIGQPETTIDEYLTKVRDDSGPGIVKDSFEENIKFEFWGQYEEKNSKPGETLRTFIEESRRKQKQNERLFWNIKKNYDRVFKKQASSIKTIEGHLGRIAKKIHGRGIGNLSSFIETNPKGLAHSITTRSGLNYNPPKNPLEEIPDNQNKTTKNISTKEGSPDNKKIITEISSSPIPFPKRLKMEKEKEQF
ncbi:hypothetical protein Tco_0819132 [Tanacetum coccineum]|uniref:Uncharacterized protein n=1 Tax=Tanacetum coccineum TaxID=301880 RepID=A0ABQ5A9X7_9ASTR